MTEKQSLINKLALPTSAILSGSQDLDSNPLRLPLIATNNNISQRSSNRSTTKSKLLNLRDNDFLNTETIKYYIDHAFNNKIESKPMLVKMGAGLSNMLGEKLKDAFEAQQKAKGRSSMSVISKTPQNNLKIGNDNSQKKNDRTKSLRGSPRRTLTSKAVNSQIAANQGFGQIAALKMFKKELIKKIEDDPDYKEDPKRTPQQELVYHFEKLIKENLFYQDMFKLKFNLEELLKKRGFTFPSCNDPANPKLSKDQKIILYNTAIDILFKTEKLYTSPTGTAPPQINKKEDFLQGRSASQIQNEAVRRAQEADLSRKGIQISESVRKRKILRIPMGNNAKNQIIEQNKIHSQMKKS